jgi:hypothetical protein
VHTGCLSAAPQRFVIGSNSFRSLTCFEVPFRRNIVTFSSRPAKRLLASRGIALNGRLGLDDIEQFPNCKGLA